ncbi:Clp protease N-terminal domain-containing protein [Kitasatospora sp. NPDC058063]|uniref:Clp protease N-terminal domain-containing protein n=1 Tax=unclassified Kitasatospora TaxID=2633591 RepID=UPI0036DBD655
MDTTMLEPDWHALGGPGDGPLGTEHLLVAVAGETGPAGAALAAAGAGADTLRALVRERKGRWTADDGPGVVSAAVPAAVPDRETPGAAGADGRPLSGAAARALAVATEHARRDGEPACTAVHLLRALLADGRDGHGDGNGANGDGNGANGGGPGDRTRAAELLRAAGVAPQAVLDRLDGAVRQGGGLDPLLHPTRETLLARRGHRAPRWKRLLQPGPSGPAAWIRPEADAQAERLGRRTPGTEHVLLALLAVHEVARHEPGLAAEDGAGELLAGLGLDYARAHAALDSGGVTLPADPRAVEAYLTEIAGQGTDRLLRALLEEDTRARRLVEALRG